MEIVLSLSKTLLKVIGGYLVASSVLAALHFPQQVDELSPPQARSDAGTFYADIYSKPAVSATSEPEPDSQYVQIARQAIEDAQMVPRMTKFVRNYHLSDKRVLDVGAGTGYLQDVVENYVGLDISPTARRYFHKPFVEGSATDMPFADGEFDAAWTVWVFEHVPKPEQALQEIRRVVKDGGILYLAPAWNCPWWLAQGYEVRPYSDFDLGGKARKASLNLLGSPYYRYAALVSTRTARRVQTAFAGGPARYHYQLLEPNYEKYWVADSDAVNNLDYYETLLWFQSRGDECLNCSTQPILDSGELILRVHKPATIPGR